MREIKPINIQVNYPVPCSKSGLIRHFSATYLAGILLIAFSRTRLNQVGFYSPPTLDFELDFWTPIWLFVFYWRHHSMGVHPGTPLWRQMRAVSTKKHKVEFERHTQYKEISRQFYSTTDGGRFFLSTSWRQISRIHGPLTSHGRQVYWLTNFFFP